jgi:hypothetical protein
MEHRVRSQRSEDRGQTTEDRRQFRCYELAIRKLESQRTREFLKIVEVDYLAHSSKEKCI